MALYPRATYRPVQGLSMDPSIFPVGVILHVTESEATSQYGWFNGPSGGIESHLHIPKTDAYPIEQYRDTEREADANYRGNRWYCSEHGRYEGFLSVETQGRGDGIWTDYQLEQIEAFIRWAAGLYGFPLTVAPSYRSPGLGYHVMFGADPALDCWSNARGKTCPGPLRIAQFRSVLLPRLAAKNYQEVDVSKFPVLGKGDSGEDVQTVQALLQARSHPEVSIDGDYGPRTVAAVKAVQEWAGLDPDGIVGPKTLAALLRLK
jgi:hypothetical protein